MILAPELNGQKTNKKHLYPSAYNSRQGSKRQTELNHSKWAAQGVLYKKQTHPLASEQWLLTANRTALKGKTQSTHRKETSVGLLMFG